MLLTRRFVLGARVAARAAVRNCGRTALHIDFRHHPGAFEHGSIRRYADDVPA